MYLFKSLHTKNEAGFAPSQKQLIICGARLHENIILINMTTYSKLIYKKD